MIKHILAALWLITTEDPFPVVMFLVIAWLLAAMLVSAVVSDAAGMVMIVILAACAALVVIALLLVIVLSFFQDVYDRAIYTKSLEEKQNDQSRQKPHSFHLRS